MATRRAVTQWEAALVCLEFGIGNQGGCYPLAAIFGEGGEGVEIEFFRGGFAGE